MDGFWNDPAQNKLLKPEPSYWFKLIEQEKLELQNRDPKTRKSSNKLLSIGLPVVILTAGVSLFLNGFLKMLGL